MKKLMALGLLGLSLAACKRADETPTPAADETAAPAPVDARASGLFSVVSVPADIDPTKADLGNRLYHDTALSGDNTLSCASCHDIMAGGDDGNRTSIGVRGQLGPINAPTTLNAGFHIAQFWDGRAADLQEQAAGPVANSMEMGAEWPVVVERLRAVPEYVAAFDALYPDGLTQDNVTDAIAAFEMTLVTPSRWDTWLGGDETALTEAERHGLDVFMATGCQSCHNGAAMGGGSFQRMGLVNDYFAARGGELTDADRGRFNFTGDEADRGMFKVPSLRNVSLTAPYFHDGSVDDLSVAVRTMGWVQLGNELSDDDVAAIVAFLEVLTGDLAVEPLPPYEAAAPTLIPEPGTLAPSPDAPAPTEGTEPG